jgi:hypothetical protein
MSIPCHVEIEGEGLKPNKSYVFATLPRIGEVIALEFDGDKYPEFVVVAVRHIPDGVEERPAYTVLRIKRLPSFS